MDVFAYYPVLNAQRANTAPVIGQPLRANCYRPAYLTRRDRGIDALS